MAAVRVAVRTRPGGAATTFRDRGPTVRPPLPLCSSRSRLYLHSWVADGARPHCASLVGRQPPISYIYRGGVTTLRTREWSLISSPSRHGVHRMHGLDGATGYRIERCRLCACTAQPLLRPKTTAGATAGMLDVDAILPALERGRCMTSHCGARCMLVLSLSARPFTYPVAASCDAGTNHPSRRA